MSLDRTRKEISAIIVEIESVPLESRRALSQAEDGEAYEIVRRIHRKLQGLPVEIPPGDDFDPPEARA